MAPRRTKSSKNPPILSQEFLIQNHADIVSCVAIVFIVGLMFQATAPVASLFITMHHNVTVNDTAGEEITLYTPGAKDLCAGFFYLLICIVVHAVVQEYVLDKLNRKMHLSKVKHSKFNESGQLLAFYFGSAAWGAHILLTENYITKLSQLWEGYPHFQMPFIIKFYFIIQIAYWLHNYPELYFQKVRKEEIPARVKYSTVYSAIIIAAYILNMNKVALCMLVLHYTVESLYHMAKLCHFSDKLQAANSLFLAYDVLFVLVRLGTITLAVLTFWYGLAQSSVSSIDFAVGNFNTPIIRLGCLAAVCISQAVLMFYFMTFHLRKLRERSPSSKKPRSPTKKKSVKAVAPEDLDSLPEVDQNSASETVRSRKVKK